MFVFGRSAFAEGVGEILAPIDLPPAWYVVVAPAAHVSTAEVFRHPELTRNSDRIRMPAFFSEPTRNDLQPVVSALVPEVRQALEWLGSFGPARMTGSGSCVFCGFPGEREAREVWSRRPAGTQGFVAAGLDRHPLADLVDD